MTLPLLPIRFSDGSVDFVISVPLHYKEAAKDLLGRILQDPVWSTKTENWARDVCRQLIVQNRPEPGIEYARIHVDQRDSLFLTAGPQSLLHLIIRNETYATVQPYLLTKTKIDVSELPIANIYSLILSDPHLPAIWPELIKMDAGTFFSSLYHVWVRREDPEKREERLQDEKFNSPEYQESPEAKELEAFYQSRVEAALQRINQVNKAQEQLKNNQ